MNKHTKAYVLPSSFAPTGINLIWTHTSNYTITYLKRIHWIFNTQNDIYIYMKNQTQNMPSKTKQNQPKKKKKKEEKTERVGWKRESWREKGWGKESERKKMEIERQRDYNHAHTRYRQQPAVSRKTAAKAKVIQTQGTAAYRQAANANQASKQPLVKQSNRPLRQASK